MATDFYWRTRTISEAQDQGYSHLRVTCSECRHTNDIPFERLLRRIGVERHTFLGNLSLRCKRCGSTSVIIGVTRHVAGA